MMDFALFNDSGDVVLHGVDQSFYPDYNVDYLGGNGKPVLDNAVGDYTDPWYLQDGHRQFVHGNNTTVAYSEDDTGRNCSEKINFFFEVNNHRSPSQYIVPIVYCVICLVGLIGNGLVMFVIFGSKEMTKTVANIYIWNLAVADTLFLVSLPFSSTQRIMLSWPFGAGMCKIVEAVKYLNYFASIFFLTAMSIDRYIAVVYVVTSSKWRTSRNTYFVCAAIWLVSLVMVVPLLIYTQVHGGMCALVFNSQESEGTWSKDIDESTMELYDYGEYEDPCGKAAFYNDYTNVSPFVNAGTEMSGNDQLDLSTIMGHFGEEEEETILCIHPDSKTFHVFLIFTFVVGFVVPFFIITICYIMIIARLLQPSETRTRSKQAERTRRKVTRMVVVLVITFFICWLPFYVWHLVLIRGVKASVGICHNVRDFTFCLGYANSCLNPILYTFLGHNFQERLRKSIAISLRSFSFTTFTRYSNTMSRAETGIHSRKMDASQSDHADHAQHMKMSQPLCQVKEEEEMTNFQRWSAACSKDKLVEKNEQANK